MISNVFVHLTYVLTYRDFFHIFWAFWFVPFDTFFTLLFLLGGFSGKVFHITYFDTFLGCFIWFLALGYIFIIYRILPLFCTRRSAFEGFTNFRTNLSILWHFMQLSTFYSHFVQFIWSVVHISLILEQTGASNHILHNWPHMDISRFCLEHFVHCMFWNTLDFLLSLYILEH